jgi:hypothetical protein
LEGNVESSEYDHGEELEKGEDLVLSPHDWSPLLVCAGSEWSLSFGYGMLDG